MQRDQDADECLGLFLLGMQNPSVDLAPKGHKGSSKDNTESYERKARDSSFTVSRSDAFWTQQERLPLPLFLIRETISFVKNLLYHHPATNEDFNGDSWRSVEPS